MRLSSYVVSLAGWRKSKDIPYWIRESKALFELFTLSTLSGNICFLCLLMALSRPKRYYGNILAEFSECFLKKIWLQTTSSHVPVATLKPTLADYIRLELFPLIEHVIFLAHDLRFP